ncbi:MAG: hypothetical protein HYX21_01840 [Candidatus Yanofskybacteria bacterium]|nr:hypothetical protein [Candidatus Yanofskybacteria bacterium]
MKETFRKFYPILGRNLGIALEATFYLDPSSKAQLPDDLRFHSLIYSDSANLLTRFYFPATVSGDTNIAQRMEIAFIPWVDRSQAAFHRICLRARKNHRAKSFDWLSLARMSEDKDFGFEPIYNKDEAYISLDFYSKRRNIFLPVFVRAKGEDGKSFSYYVIESEKNPESPTEKVVMTVRTIKASEAPPPWITVK